LKNPAYEGHCEDGSGIQKHSAGEYYPWVHTCVENHELQTGFYYYKHPSGRVTDHASYPMGDDEARRKAYAEADRRVENAIAADRARASDRPKGPAIDIHNKVLPNGALMIARVGIVVLARRPKCDGFEYVTWLVDDKLNAASGKYFPGNGRAAKAKDFLNAMNDMVERAAVWYC
jgi:hypothetical protein